MQKIWKTTGQEGCDDCQWLAIETEGDLPLLRRMRLGFEP